MKNFPQLVSPILPGEEQEEEKERRSMDNIKTEILKKYFLQNNLTAQIYLEVLRKGAEKSLSKHLF